MKKFLFVLFVSLLVNGSASISHADDSRPCSVYPASVTPECVAENLAFEQQRQANYEAQQRAAQEEAKRAEEANTQRQFEENGSRACSVYPASVTPECVAENLIYEAQRQAAYEAERIARNEASKKAEQEQAQLDYVANGSRPCSLYPASVTPECVAENLIYEAQRQATYEAQQRANQEAAKKAEEASKQKQFEENGSRPCSLYPASTTTKCIAENLKFEGNRKVTDELSNKLKAINTQSSANKVGLPISNKIVEKYQVSTPKICKISGNSVVRLKNGNCEIKVTYVTDQNFKVETTKKITFKK
jgi:hypothetical protein